MWLRRGDQLAADSAAQTDREAPGEILILFKDRTWASIVVLGELLTPSEYGVLVDGGWRLSDNSLVLKPAESVYVTRSWVIVEQDRDRLVLRPPGEPRIVYQRIDLDDAPWITRMIVDADSKL